MACSTPGFLVQLLELTQTHVHWVGDTHSSILAWRIPGTAEPGGLPSVGSHRVGHDLACPPGSSVHGILQARTLVWVASPFSRGSSWSRDRTRVSCTAGRFFTVWATTEALHHLMGGSKNQENPNEPPRTSFLYLLQKETPPPPSPTSSLYVKKLKVKVA